MDEMDDEKAIGPELPLPHMSAWHHRKCVPENTKKAFNWKNEPSPMPK